MLGIETPEWLQGVLAWIKQHDEFGAAICFLLGLGESVVILSLFVPSSVLMPGIGAVQSAAGGPFWTVWLAGAAGSVVGDVVSFLIGWYFKEQVPNRWPFTRYPGLIPRARAVFERWGWLSILAGKFALGLRPFLPVAAGMLSMPLAVFLFASVVSSLAWSAVFLAPGFGAVALLK